ncbi:hypothetical protein K431DRAFT_76803 [Polychaeton citri CBS 116435]|uniref:Secreted protein n=1 Tax=Polychaeton citri CBS 116435 TaxID=1314669 RepID=A0A9P4Q5V1_9PEZI|nr:hypothetical protein K431DRAFT_76803 [Polychaeton citri CBS 116435]
MKTLNRMLLAHTSLLIYLRVSPTMSLDLRLVLGFEFVFDHHTARASSNPKHVQSTRRKRLWSNLFAVNPSMQGMRLVPRFLARRFVCSVLGSKPESLRTNHAVSYDESDTENRFRK